MAFLLVFVNAYPFEFQPVAQTIAGTFGPLDPSRIEGTMAKLRDLEKESIREAGDRPSGRHPDSRKDRRQADAEQLQTKCFALKYRGCVLSVTCARDLQSGLWGIYGCLRLSRAANGVTLPFEERALWRTTQEAIEVAQSWAMAHVSARLSKQKHAPELGPIKDLRS